MKVLIDYALTADCIYNKLVDGGVITLLVVIIVLVFEIIKEICRENFYVIYFKDDLKDFFMVNHFAVLKTVNRL